MRRRLGYVLAVRTLPVVLSAFAILGSAPLTPCQDEKPTQERNSSRKIRPEPSEVAASAGSDVKWQTDLDDALAESRKTGRPVFWYVPTLDRSPMDRQREVDRYMMAGPFCWPECIEALNRDFVPLRKRGARADRERFEDLVPGKFVEPGFLILSEDGNVLARWDEITTLHPEWWRRRLMEALPEEKREAYGARWYGWSRGEGVAAEFRTAAGLWADGYSDDARLLWKTLAADHPTHPLGRKAAAEAEGHGPFVYGFEIVDDLPEAAFAPGPRGTRAPANVWQLPVMRSRHLQFWNDLQRLNGGIVDSRYDFGGTDGLPNVHVAVSALVSWALLEQRPQTASMALKEQMRVTFEDLTKYVVDDDNLNPVDTDEYVWAVLYRMRLYARWLDLRPMDDRHVQPRLADAVEEMWRLQMPSGAWAHEYPNPFVTASVLVGLHHAKRHGIEILPDAVSRGIGSLKACRTADGAVTYGQARPGRPARARIQGGVGRMPLLEHALLLWDEGSQQDLENALAASFENEAELFRVRKYDDHASREGYGGFFFWYDLHVRWEALQALENEDKRKEWMRSQTRTVKGLPEFDGCFIDSHEIGRAYGTAMAWLSGLAGR